MFNTSAQELNSPNTSYFELKYLARLPNMVIEKPSVLFLLHGAGRNEQDLFPFASQLPDEWLVISARETYTVSEGHYNWYDVKMVDKNITIDFPQEE